MVDLISKHLMGTHETNQNFLPGQYLFPRLPPGVIHPTTKFFQRPLDGKFLKLNDLSNLNLKDYQHWYQQHIAKLLEINPNLIPPGHPMYSRQTSVETLQNENQKLQKENLELRMQLEKLSKSK